VGFFANHGWELILGLILVAIALQFAVWLWICLRATKSGWRGPIGAWAIQYWGVLGLHFLLLADSADAVVLLIFMPLLYPVAIGMTLTDYPDFTLSVLPVPVVLAVAVFWLFFCQPGKTAYSLGLSMLVLLVSGHVSAEIASRAAMCRQVEVRGLTGFKRNTFLWSLRNAPEEFQDEIHAMAWLGDSQFGWSYRDMDWYEIPEDTGGWVQAPLFDCSFWTR
jgi:hypothetical protein